CRMGRLHCNVVPCGHRRRVLKAANPKQPFSRLNTVSWFSILGRQARRMLLTALLGGLLGATLVRLGPGFGVDERELNMSLSSESVAAMRQERAAERNIPS